MSARTAMRHRCTTQRNQAPADEWGAPGPPDWQPNLSDQPCHAWLDAARRVIGPDQDVMVVDIRLLMPLGSDVKESDRVAQVTDRLGTTTVVAGPLLIDTIGQRKDHLVLLLKEVS